MKGVARQMQSIRMTFSEHCSTHISDATCAKSSLEPSRSLVAKLAMACLGLLAVLTGCSTTYHVRPPTTPLVKYHQQGANASLAISNTRPSEPEFSHGKLTIYVEFDGSPDEMAYFAKYLSQDLRARGIAVTEGASAGSHALQVRVTTC